MDETGALPHTAQQAEAEAEGKAKASEGGRA